MEEENEFKTDPASLSPEERTQQIMLTRHRLLEDSSQVSDEEVAFKIKLLRISRAESVRGPKATREERKNVPVVSLDDF